jgi:hypothetical protein
MRRNYSLASVGLFAILLGGALVACSNRADNCALNGLRELPDGTCDESYGSSGTGGSKPDCSGEPSAKNITESCGVFVQADAAGATEDGTEAHPFKTLQKAIDTAGGKRVYACASAAFKEAVTIAAGVEVYGGFDCTKGWTWSQDARAQLDGPGDKVALTIGAGAEGAKVEGFAITAASPSDPKGGASSIGVAVADVTVTIERCDVTAKDAADGLDGQTPSGMAMKGADAAMPDAATMNACINPNALKGGASGVTMCGSVDVSGGTGGKGGITGMPDGNGQPGANGIPLPSPNPTNSGVGGVGQTDLIDVTKFCQKGADGEAGGNGGPGLPGTAVGTLSVAGITGGDGQDGVLGKPGQGGGGGGGAKSGVFCPGGPVDGNGASGGGGGAGGCGGLGGGGGKAGGSSIAIVSLGTKLTLTEVTLATGKGGKGGTGVVGQGGGAVGKGASGGAASGLAGSKAGCTGGDGGVGGDGGPGGGGRGGHSIGIAYASAPAAMPAIKTFMPGTAGAGGTAGMGAPMTSNGATGSAGLCWDFTANTACK